jgi:acyl carrier protein
MNIEEKIKEYLKMNTVMVDASAQIGHDDALGLDSLSIIRFVAFLEEEFKVKIEDEELISENFHTMGQVVNLIKPKMPT